MKWKQQSGQFRLAPASRLPLSSLKTIYLAHEVRRPLGRHTLYRHTQCRTVSSVAELVESMKFIGESATKKI